MVVTFDNDNQLAYVTSVVKSMADVCSKSSTNTIGVLSDSLTRLLNSDVELTAIFNDDSDQLVCLYNICRMLNNIGADEVNACSDMYLKLKKLCTKQEVQMFVGMLNKYNIHAEYCIELFINWCSGEGIAVMANECMRIQALHKVDMTPVWEWLCNNESLHYKNWEEEVKEYKEFIDGRS